MKKAPAFAVIFAATFLTISSINHAAQAQIAIQQPTVTNTYAAKFICGVQTDMGNNSVPDAQPGRYSSKINVHNNTGVLINYRKKIIEVTGGRQEPHEPVKIKPEALKPDAAMEVVCKDIYGHINTPNQSPTRYMEGFVILEVFQPLQTTTPAPPPDPLDVEGIYTYTNLPGGPAGQITGVSISVVVYPAKNNKHPLQ